MDLAAATAAPKVITLGDKQYTFSRLTLRDWGELEVAALDNYRREFMQIRLKNADLLADGDVEGYRKRVIADALALKLDDLPKRTARVFKSDAKGQPLTTPDGAYVFEQREVEYQVWWFNETLEGRLFAIWLSLRKVHVNLTINDIDNLLMDEFIRAGLDSVRLANMVGEISSPSLGNSQPPPRAAAVEVTMEQLGATLSDRRARRTRRRRTG